MKLSLVVPCFNEADNIKPFYDLVITTFEDISFDYEFVFVDDGSKDETLNELKKLHNEDSQKVKIISFSRNFGKESAIYAGIEHSNGDYISLIDADLQQNPKYVLEMVKILDENNKYDIVAAYQDRRNEGKVLAFFKKCFYSIINHLSDTRFKSDASDFRAFRRSVANEIIKLSETHRFSKGIFSWVGYNTCFIPYEVEKRASGSSKWNFFKLSNYAIEGIVSYSKKPLRFSFIMSAIIALLFIIYLVMIIAGHFAAGSIISGVSIAILLILFIGSIQFACIGLIGEYIGRTFEQSKHRPIYIAKEIIK